MNRLVCLYYVYSNIQSKWFFTNNESQKGLQINGSVKNLKKIKINESKVQL